MEKINLNEARRLNRILTGKEKAPSRHEEKRLKTEIVMDLKALKKDLMKDINLDPGLETERYLFSFKNKFHFVVNKQYTKYENGAEVRTLMEDQPETNLYYICIEKEVMCSLPEIFTGKPCHGVMLKSKSNVLDFIERVSGARIKLSDL